LARISESRTSKTVGESVRRKINRFLIVAKAVTNADGDPETDFTEIVIDISDAGV
jgi:hypothetical protein